MTILIGITGGIGSGKSIFSKEVEKRGYKLFDSDKEVALIYQKPTKDFLNHLKKINLGNSIEKTKINKKKISQKIFIDKKIKNNLEKYIFFIVRKKRAIFTQREKKKKTKIIFFDIPLLFENNLKKEFDMVISLISPKKERYKRLKRSKKLTKDLFNKIIKSQTSNLVRKNKSDIVIYNNGTMKEYLRKINNVLDKITL